MIPKYLFDTDTLSHLEDGHPHVLRRTEAVPFGDWGTTVVTVEERLTGWYTFLRKATRPEKVEMAYRELAETVAFLGAIPIVLLTQSAIVQTAELARTVQNVRRNDLRIAAIALEHRAVVVTANTVDFRRVPGLVVEDWTQP